MVCKLFTDTCLRNRASVWQLILTGMRKRLSLSIQKSTMKITILKMFDIYLLL